MEVKLLHYTPAIYAIEAIRTCWDSFDKSDSNNFKNTNKLEIENTSKLEIDNTTKVDSKNTKLGENDTKLLRKIVHTHKHTSTIEHLHLTFKINGISRLCLQELARHRIASYSVKSSRYTLKELTKNTDIPEDTYLSSFLVKSGNEIIDYENIKTLKTIKQLLRSNIKNDIIKYMLPEAYKVDLVFSINARALRNLLELRLSGSAHFEIRELADNLLKAIPEEYSIIFEDFNILT